MPVKHQHYVITVFFLCACVLAKARMEKAEQIKEKKKEKKNVKHEEERVRVTVAL